MKNNRIAALLGLTVAALILVAAGAAVAAGPFLSQPRVERAATARAAQICTTNPKCTGSSAQCDDRVARNAFSCDINTFYPRHKSCYFINLWVLRGHPPVLTHRRYAKGSYPGGPYGLACQSDLD